MTGALGIDIGGSGIKGAPVDLEKGAFTVDRLRIPTPQKSTPPAVADVVAQIMDHFHDQIDKKSPIGITVPAPAIHGLVPSIANLHKSWNGCQVQDVFAKRLGRDVLVVNDADAAGVAEVRYGAGLDHPGLILMTTLGTGIGTAIIHNGVLIPNAELGHLEIDGHDAEKHAAASARERDKMSYKEWATHLQTYYSRLENLLYPDLIIVGGGVSREHEKFLPLLKLRTPIVPAKLRNQAGIIGAAWLAAHQ